MISRSKRIGLSVGLTVAAILCGHVAMYTHLVLNDTFWTTVFTVDAILLGTVAFGIAMTFVDDA